MPYFDIASDPRLKLARFGTATAVATAITVLALCQSANTARAAAGVMVVGPAGAVSITPVAAEVQYRGPICYRYPALCKPPLPPKPDPKGIKRK